MPLRLSGSLINVVGCGLVTVQRRQPATWSSLGRARPHTPIRDNPSGPPCWTAILHRHKRSVRIDEVSSECWESTRRFQVVGKSSVDIDIGNLFIFLCLTMPLKPDGVFCFRWKRWNCKRCGRNMFQLKNAGAHNILYKYKMGAQESFHSRRVEECVATYTHGVPVYTRRYGDLFQCPSTSLICSPVCRFGQIEWSDAAPTSTSYYYSSTPASRWHRKDGQHRNRDIALSVAITWII